MMQLCLAPTPCDHVACCSHPVPQHSKKLTNMPLCCACLSCILLLLLPCPHPPTDAVPDHCPRCLINRERVGEGMGGGLMASLLGFSGGGFVFEGSEGAYRDVLYLGDTDDGVRQLAELLGWQAELDTLIAAGGIGGPPAGDSSGRMAPASSREGSSGSKQDSSSEPEAAASPGVGAGGKSESSTSAAAADPQDTANGSQGSAPADPEPQSKV